ncbi:unnamed protein product [Sphenostylis stenocarpa]|uniref:Uncharacterized protein n=1 Tax=Sphenostylis stenocarpa TaxID=92480 RepID=A0AA86SLI6_9FABA|nr:unnamed protein product [Sphenostylis stenocarpa]
MQISSHLLSLPIPSRLSLSGVPNLYGAPALLLCGLCLVFVEVKVERGIRCLFGSGGMTPLALNSDNIVLCRIALAVGHISLTVISVLSNITYRVTSCVSYISAVAIFPQNAVQTKKENFGTLKQE